MHFTKLLVILKQSQFPVIVQRIKVTIQEEYYEQNEE